MKKRLIGVVLLAFITGSLNAAGPANLSVGWGRAMTPGDPVEDLPAAWGAYLVETSNVPGFAQDITVTGYDITFTLSIEAANASLINGDGTTGLINSRVTGEDICILGGSSDIRTDARDPGESDDEGLRLILSASGSGVTNLTDLSLDFLRVRRFSTENGPNGQITFYDGTNRTGNSFIGTNTHDEFLGDFVYTDHPVLTNEYTLTELTPLSTNNIGGIGDGSWVMELYATDALTNSTFSLGDIKVNFSLAHYENTAPEADDLDLETPIDTALDITLRAYDFEQGPLTYVILDQPTSGIVTGTTPNVTYVPDTGFTGNDSFTFTASDGGLSSTGTVSITVTPEYHYMAFGEDYYSEGGIPWNFETAATNSTSHTTNGITFTVTLVSANESGSYKVYNRNTGNDISITEGNRSDRIDPRSAGPADDEGLRMTVSVAGEGVSNLTEIALDEIVLRRFSTGTEIVHYYDGPNGTGTPYPTTHAAAAVSGNELFPAGGLTPLSLANAGGAGNGSWLLEMWCRTDGQDFNLGDVKLRYALKSTSGTTFADWAAGWGVNIGTQTNDYEPDGMDNLMEYALGGNPTNEDAATVLPAYGILDDGSNWFYHIHTERTDDSTLSFTVDMKTDLVADSGWTTNGLIFTGESPVVDHFKSVTNRTDIDSAEFIRMKVEQN